MESSEVSQKEEERRQAELAGQSGEGSGQIALKISISIMQGMGLPLVSSFPP